MTGASRRLKIKLDPRYAEGVVSRIGADKTDRYKVARDIANHKSSILHQCNVDVEIPSDGACEISVQSKFMRGCTRLIALHKEINRGSGMVGVAVVFLMRAEVVEYGYSNVSSYKMVRKCLAAFSHPSPYNRSRIVLLYSSTH